MKQVFLSLFFLICTTASAYSDVSSDLAYIVEEHMLATQTEKQLARVTQKALTDIRPAIHNFGAEIVDEEEFLKALLGGFNAEMLELTRRSWIELYEAVLSPLEIVELAAFYRTNEGQALLAKGLNQDKLESSISFLKDGAGAPLLEHWSELEIASDEMHSIAVNRLQQNYSLERIADIMEMEHIIVFANEDQRHSVVKALRAAD